MRVLLRLLVPLVLVAAVVVDLRLPAPAPPEPVAPPTGLAAGSATCAVGATEDGAGLTALLLAGDRPASLGDAASAGLRVLDGATVVADVEPGTDGAVATAAVPDGLAAPVLALRWRTAPFVLARSWSRPGDATDPGFRVSGPCPTAAAEQWVVPGVATSEGASASVHLANPTAATATARLRLTTPGGPVEPARLRNVVVAAGEELVLDLTDFAPEEPDLGVVVELEAGRLVVEAVQELEPTIGGVAGATLVAAINEPAASWTIPWVDADDTTSSWAWVTNPGTTVAEVALVGHTPDGEAAGQAARLVLQPGTTERVDLARLATADGASAVSLVATGEVPVAVDAMVVVGDDRPRRSGVTGVAAAAPSVGPVVALAVGDAQRSHLLQLTNPGDAPTTVDVEVRGTSGLVEDAGVTGVDVPAGATLALELSRVPEGAFGVVATPRDGVLAAALVSRSRGRDLELVATTAVPFPRLGVTPGVRTTPDATLLQRTGTPLQP